MIRTLRAVGVRPEHTDEKAFTFTCSFTFTATLAPARLTGPESQAPSSKPIAPQLMRRLLVPTAPVPGSPPLMGNGKNEEVIVFGDVKQVVGKLDQDLSSNPPLNLLG